VSSLFDALIDNGFIEVENDKKLERLNEFLEHKLQETKELLVEYRPALDALAENLLKYKTLSAQDVRDIIEYNDQDLVLAGLT